jgi:hypothetical protein
MPFFLEAATPRKALQKKWHVNIKGSKKIGIVNSLLLDLGFLDLPTSGYLGL